MNIETPRLNWHDWMQRWDSQQSGYLPDREERFTAMLDVQVFARLVLSGNTWTIGW